jgi:hypothetical protein
MREWFEPETGDESFGFVVHRMRSMGYSVAEQTSKPRGTNTRAFIVFGAVRMKI